MADLSITIDLHYFMKDKNLHDMDASVNHKCGQSLVNVINNLGDVFDEDVQVDIAAIGKGGFKDIYKVIVRNIKSESAFVALLTCLLTHFIGVAPSSDETQKQLNRVEIISKIKEGEFSENEINFIITGDPKYIKNRNSFYHSLNKEPNVAKVTCTALNNESNEKILDHSCIEKKDFEDQIITKESKEVIDEYAACSILVTSPVLMQGHTSGWRGLFNNQPIIFKIMDKAFLEKVYSKEVAFAVGTTLMCDLKVISETKFDEVGHELETTRVYSISNVVSYTEANDLPEKKKLYEKKRKSSMIKESSLYDNPNFFEK